MGAIRVMMDDNSHDYLIQKISVAIQKGNAASVLGCLDGGLFEG